MDVTKELPDIPIRTSVTEKGVVIQNDMLPADTNRHLLGDEFETVHKALSEVFDVVVS